MFQSSRIASGICRWHVCTASSPFSASTIWKSSPSRIRRATLRMTLESSTTKHVFIVSSLYPSRRWPLPPQFKTLISVHTSCRGRLGAEVKHPIDVENDEKLPIEPKHAGGHASELAVEIDRVGLAFAVRQFEDLAHRIDHKTERFGA